MVDGINFNGKVGNISGIKSTTSSNIGNNETKVGTFGFGFQSAGTSFERNIVPEALLNKFNFEPPKYEKNIAQLEISDKDYIPDKQIEEPAFCEC